MKEELKPVDLGRLEEKALVVVDYFRRANNSSRSHEYRTFYLKQAESVANNLLRDFGYYFDKYKIGGVVSYGLDETPAIKKINN